MLVTRLIPASIPEMRNCLLTICWTLTLASSGHADTPADLAKQIAIIQAVEPEGVGNRNAAAAFQVLSRSGASSLLPLLSAIEASNPIARNWLRASIEVIVERQIAY